MIVYNNQAPDAVNNVGQFGATEGSIGAYKQAAEYAADAKYWALLAESKFSTVDELIAEVERLYKQGILMQEDIEQLKEDFASQDIRLMQLISEANAAASNANNAADIANQKISEIQRQLDILLNMTVTTTTLPAGSQATGTFDPTTGKFAFGIPQGQDGSVTDLGSVATGVPVIGDLGFYVDQTTNSVYKTTLEDIANLTPSVRSVSLNGGPAASGEVALTVDKATVGLSNVKNVASYSEAEINDKLDGFTKLYKTKAEADADAVNRLAGEHVLVWNGASYEFYTVAANKTLTLVSTEGKVLTVNSKEPDSTGNIDILIPTGNPSLYLGEITRFPLGSGSTVTYPGLVQTDGSLIERATYPDLGSSLVQGNVSVVSETVWQAGEKDSFSWGKLSDGVTDADSSNYINIRVPLIADTDSMRSYVVASRDAAVVGVSTIDGQAGAVNLTGKYLQKTDAAAIYQTKTEGASKDYVLDSIQPIMEGALFKADPFIDNNTPFRSAGANGVESVDMIKVTPENSIKIGSYASSVQGVEIHSAGRLQVVDQNDSGVETKYPVYSKRFRPEIEDLPFAAIGSYVKDSKGRTVGVNRTGINSDIKQFTQKVTFQQPVTVADGVGDYDAVAFKQMKDYVASIKTVDTSWSVINGDASATPDDDVFGGQVLSKYQINGVDRAIASMRSSWSVGDNYQSTIQFDNKATDSGGTAITDATYYLGGPSGQVLTDAKTGLGDEGGISVGVSLNANDFTTNGIYAGAGASGVNWGDAYVALLHMSRYNDYLQRAQLQISTAGLLRVRGAQSTTWSAWSVMQAQGTSGREFKRDITPADPKEAFDRIASQDLVTFIYKDDEQERVRFGIIAEDAERIAPQYIKHGEEAVEVDGEVITRDHPRVDVNPIVMDLIGAVHYLRDEVEQLKAELAELKASK